MKFLSTIGIIGGLSFLSLAWGGNSTFTNLDQALTLMAQTSSGKKLIDRALKKFNLQQKEDLKKQVLRLGDVSRTDAVLTRHYDPNTGQETRERQVFVVLKQNQSFEHLLLDLAHELTHAIERSHWDPYDPDLSIGAYVKSAIEGSGGEVEALLNECHISRELFEKFGLLKGRCEHYVNDWGQIDRKRIVEDFYRVGRWYSEVQTQLDPQGKLFPHLSAEAPALFSSTGRAPYPLALLEEYRELTQMACQNSKKRMESQPTRELASNVVSHDQKFLSRRCLEFRQSSTLR